MQNGWIVDLDTGILLAHTRLSHKEEYRWFFIGRAVVKMLITISINDVYQPCNFSTLLSALQQARPCQYFL